jgi:ABC-2 type transport system permease protein
MRLFLSSSLMQFRLSRKSPDTLQACVTAPLLTVVFLTISQYSRTSVTSFAVVAPTLMALWTTGLFTAGQMITDDRNLGTLESVLATPAPLPVVLLGRMCAVTMMGLVAFAESWLAAGIVFGRWLAIPHPFDLLAVLVVTGLATAGSAGLLSPLFVLTPSARTVQNTLSYPFYLLSGVLVPITFLPGWLQPMGRLVFLSWSADLLRASLARPPVTGFVPGLAVILLLGAIGYAVGVILLMRVLRAVRLSGTVVHT